MKVAANGALVPVKGFSRVRDPRAELHIEGGALWRSHDGILVSSSCTDIQLPVAPEGMVGPTWLVSVSYRFARPDLDVLMRAITGFAMPAWDEDNHNPGIARHLFCPVDERWRNACECKVDELLITDPDGYQWTTPRDGRCSGCVYSDLTWLTAHVRRPCPIHTTTKEQP